MQRNVFIAYAQHKTMLLLLHNTKQQASTSSVAQMHLGVNNDRFPNINVVGNVISLCSAI